MIGNQATNYFCFLFNQLLTVVDSGPVCGNCPRKCIWRPVEWCYLVVNAPLFRAYRSGKYSKPKVLKLFQPSPLLATEKKNLWHGVSPWCSPLTVAYWFATYNVGLVAALVESIYLFKWGKLYCCCYAEGRRFDSPQVAQGDVALWLQHHLTSQSNKQNSNLFAIILLNGNKFNSRLCWRQRILQIGFTIQFVLKFCLVRFVLIIAFGVKW